MVMEKFGKALDNMIRRIRKLPRIDKDALKLVIQDLQRALLSADVNVEITLALTESIQKRHIVSLFLYMATKSYLSLNFNT